MSLVARSDKSVAPIGSLSAALKSILTCDEFFAGLYGRPTIQAIAGVVAYSSPKFLRSVGLAMCFAAMATASDDVSFVFRGEVYRDHPTWLTVPNSLWARFRRELGFEVHSSAVFGVIAAQSCDAERLPWKELGYNSVNWWSIGFHQLGSSGFGGDSL